MATEENQFNDWDSIEKTDESEVTLAQMDLLVTVLRELRTDYEQKKEASSEAHGKYKEQEAKVIGALRASKRRDYRVQGIGLVVIREEEAYRTPKTNDEKTRLFNYIKDKYGPDVLMGMASINSQTLNSWANKEAETGVMSIPGLEAPTMTESLSFRRA